MAEPAADLSLPLRGSRPFQGWGQKREHALAGNREMQGFSAPTREVACRGACAWGVSVMGGEGRERKGLLSSQKSVALGVRQACVGPPVPSCVASDKRLPLSESDRS